MTQQPDNFFVDNASGADVRDDLNNIFDAIGRNNGYGSPITTPLPYMWYANTLTDKMGFYKASVNSGRHEFISLTNGNFFAPVGSASSPSYTFTDSTSTGFYRPAVNRIGVSNAGAETALFKVDGVDLKGHLNINPPTGEAYIQVQTTANNEEAYIDFVTDSTFTDYGLRLVRDASSGGVNGNSSLTHRGTGLLEIKTEDVAPLVFTTQNGSRFQLTATGSFVPVGSSFANASTTGGAVCAKGFGTRNGADTDSGFNNNASASTDNLFNFWWDTTTNNAYFFIDNTRLGHIDNSTTCDYRTKRNVTDLVVSGIERIKNLRPITFQHDDFGLYKKNDIVHEGFIAHEVGEVIPDACTGEKDKGLQSIQMAPMVATLTKALQEAVAKIETLEAKVAALEAS